MCLLSGKTVFNPGILLYMRTIITPAMNIYHLKAHGCRSIQFGIVREQKYNELEKYLQRAYVNIVYTWGSKCNEMIQSCCSNDLHDRSILK